MKLIQKLKEKKKRFDNMSMEGLSELANDLQDTKGKLYCQYCEKLMPMFKMIVKAKSVEIGETYKIKCRRCKKINIITKGANNEG